MHTPETCDLLPEHPGQPCVQMDRSVWPGWIPVPSVTWNEIIKGLYQGGSFLEPGVEPTHHDFDAVVTFYNRAPDPAVPHVLRHIFSDSSDRNQLPPPDEIDDVAGWVLGHLLHERRVLVRCQAGLNRSGLVVARVLTLLGYSVDDAMRTIRTRRSPYALCNPLFATYLQELVDDAA